MPRTVSPILRKMYERSNPRVRYAVELHRPDLSLIFRRQDQFLGAARVSEVPIGDSAVDALGGLSLRKFTLNIADFHVDNGTFGLLTPDATTHLRGVMWTPDPAFPASIARTVTVKLHRNTTRTLSIALQIYKLSRVITGTVNPGIRRAVPKGTNGVVQTAFVPLLHDPLVLRTDQVVWAADNAEFAFDLTGLQLPLWRNGVDGGANGQELSGEQPRYFFVVECNNGSANNQFEWLKDSTTARTVAGVGTFQDSLWQNFVPDNPSGWGETLANQVPYLKLDVESYQPTCQLVYAFDLGAVPSADAAVAGSVLFERAVPTGASATLELSTAGAGGPWTVVHHGDAIALKQQTYHLRVTLNADAAHRQAPHIFGMGVQFRQTVDASLESVVDPVVQAISLPFCEATIGQGSVNVLRTGRRDYRDVGSDLASAGAASAIEAEIHLMSDHPSVARADWLTLTRAPVSDRAPTDTAEQFTLLSILKQLQKKVPAREETINTAVTVTASTTGVVTLSGHPLGLAHAWDGLNYYIRVQKSAVAGVETGYVQTIDTNPADNQLGFSTLLPAAFAVGDILEVHSGQFQQPVKRWVNQDPADVWYDIITNLCAVPDERIGRAELGRVGRSGMPPRVTDRAPGDAVAQAKLKVTLQLQQEEDADKLVDQVSFLMGGATVEVAGQIVFRQIYPVRDATGTVVIQAEPVAAIFDERNTIKPDTPAGLEQRITSLACDYGVDTTTVVDSTAAEKTTEFVDVDALAYLAAQDLHELGHATVPAEIARWCFNSADQGLLLASLMCQQVVFIASTGLRVWSWGSTEAMPQLVVGDRVAFITDQYTDFDPSRGIPIRGRYAYSLVVTNVAAGGRQFSGLVMGLATAKRIVRGGPGTLTPGDGISTDNDKLYNHKQPDSVDGLSKTIQMTAGPDVFRVFVYVNTLPAPVTIDPWPPTPDAIAGGTPPVNPTATLTPDPDTGLIAVQVVKPSAQNQTFVQFEALDVDLNVTDVWRVEVNPAASAMAGTLHAVRTNALADLTVGVVAGPADWPVQLDVYADSPFSAPILTVAGIVANTTFDKTSGGCAALGGLALPQREIRRFFAILTNVAGQVTAADPIGVDRDPLPAAYVTLNDYRAAPTLKVTYDSDTDQVKLFVPGGKTKTFAGLVGAGVVTYTVGDALDDASTESALAIDESRSGYRIEITGGGQALVAWGDAANSGVLHGETTGPSLTVTVTPFASTADIAFSGTGVITYSIDGGSYATPPSSPITGIARGATVDHTYTFKCVQAGQTVTDTVVIPSLQSDAIVPDLTVTPGTPTSTTQPFTVVATNPRAGGAAPTISVTPFNCSMVIGGTTFTTPQTIASGTVVTANRQSTVTDTQAHIQVTAAIASAGSESIDVEIISQLNFGPTLNVQATPGATPGANWSVVWSGTGTVVWSVNGASYTTPTASPVAVAPDATLDKHITFKATKDGQDIVDSVTIPSVQSDSVTPDLVVVPGTMTSATIPYTATFASPRSSGTAASGIAQVYGSCSMVIAGTTYVAADGFQSIVSGTVVTVNRAASTTNTKDHVRFRAAIVGGGSEELVFTVPPQLNVGPSLTVTVTPGSGSYSIAYSGSGTITVSIDGGSYSSPASSPIVVTRTGSDHTYTFKAVADGQTVAPAPVIIPAVQTDTGVGITSVTLSGRNDPCDGGGSWDVSWTTSGLPNSGVTFDVFIEVLAGTRGAHSQNHIAVASGGTQNIDLCPDSTGQVTVTAHYSGSIVAIGSTTF